ncbi:hypothetical protein N7508_000466 [Penicillium antarcticum]|uniref:uncharacterized protein n=1 Tax=Penicillium antarcticum TaxID=416450 RepID=UPI002399D288|nr:uncharacterized protein N7508_000466 [Penicillium antarcticum]KAJ5320183.1 hypothetical protein N7508_000466 [Penicillium antarcticum]
MNGEPTCQERALYPVFDPQDPRHNPQAQSFSLYRQRSLNSSESRKRNQWTQSIPRQSFRRVRSRLLALRASLLRRSAVEDDQLGDTAELRSFVSPVALRREREQHGLRQAAFSLDTQDDLGFGTEIHRTGTPWPTIEVHEMEVHQGHDISDSVTPAPRIRTRPSGIPPTTFPTITVYRSPDLISVVESPLSDPVESPSSHNNNVDYQLERELTSSTGAVPAQLERQLDGHAADTSLSFRNLTPRGVTGTTNKELDMSSHELGDTQPAWAKQPTEGNGAQRDSMSDVSGYVAVQQRMRGNGESESRLSSRSSRSTTPSIFRHLSVHTACQGVNVRLYPSRVTEQELASAATNPATVTISRQCSAEVEFAFPGIYQEMLEQWMREPRQSQVALATELEGTSSVLQKRTRTNSAQHPVAQDDACDDLPSYDEYDQDALILESPQKPSVIVDASVMEDLQPLDHSGPSFAEDLDRQHFDNGSQGLTHSPNTIDEVLYHESSSTNATNLKARHSFGLHISLSSDCASGTEHVNATFQNLQDGPEYPRLYADSTSPDCTSAEVTSMTSMSSDPWSPIDSEVLFPTSTVNANEYYLVDGKDSTYYHDRGNQPVKTSRQATSEDNSHCLSSLDWTSSIRSREMTEVMYPSNMSVQLASHSAHGTDLSYDEDETEMYDIEYRGLPSHPHW